MTLGELKTGPLKVLSHAWLACIILCYSDSDLFKKGCLKKKVVFGSYLQTARAIDMKSGKQHVKWSQITAFEVMAIVSAVCLAVLYQSMLGCCVVTHVFCLNHIQSLTLN